MVQCVFFFIESNRYFHGNDKRKIWRSAKHGFSMNQIYHRKSDASFWNYDKGNMQEQKDAVRLISNKSRKHFKPSPALFNELNKRTEGRTLFWWNCYTRYQNVSWSFVLKPWKFCWFVFSRSWERDLFSTSLSQWI